MIIIIHLTALMVTQLWLIFNPYFILYFFYYALSHIFMSPVCYSFFFFDWVLLNPLISKCWVNNYFFPFASDIANYCCWNIFFLSGGGGVIKDFSLFYLANVTIFSLIFTHEIVKLFFSIWWTTKQRFV